MYCYVLLVPQARALLNQRLDPGWSFASFYIIKDSLALLLEGAGLSEDAYHEHMELEACYLEALERGTASPAGTLSEEFGEALERGTASPDGTSSVGFGEA